MVMIDDVDFACGAEDDVDGDLENVGDEFAGTFFEFAESLALAFNFEHADGELGWAQPIDFDALLSRGGRGGHGLGFLFGEVEMDCTRAVRG